MIFIKIVLSPYNNLSQGLFALRIFFMISWSNDSFKLLAHKSVCLQCADGNMIL